MPSKMKLFAYLSFVSFTLPLTAASVYGDGKLFLPLLLKIRTLYRSSAVFVIQPKNESENVDALFISHLTHVWCRLLGRENVVTLAIGIDEMHALTRYYNSIVCPLIIVLINGRSTFNEFSEKSKSFKMSFASWLVIFIPTPQDMDEHCYNPSGNPFHLSFDTKMLVLCGEDFTLREWYSVDSESTEIFELARWYPDENAPDVAKLEMFTDLSLYDRRKDLKGLVLRGVAVQTSILLKAEKNKMYGYFGKIINELKTALNFSIDIVAEEHNYGSFNRTTNSWNGAMRLLAAGEVDIGVSDFSITNLRLDYVDFTIPLLTTRTNLNLRQSDFFNVNWSAYLKTFSVAVWFSVLIVIFIAQLVMTFIRSRIESCCMKKLMYDEFMQIWSIVCQQGLSEFSQRSSLRLAYFSMSGFSLLVSSAYSAMLICFLTSPIRKSPFRSIEEFIQDGTYKIIVMKDSSEYDTFALSRDSLSVAMMKLMKPNFTLPSDIETGFQDMCNDEKLAFYNSFNSQLRVRSASVHVPCKMSTISFGRIDSLSLILSKNNQYTSLLNYHLQKLLNSGLLNRYRKDTQYHGKSKLESVGFNRILFPLMIFIFGAMTALILLVLEICYYKCECFKDLSQSQSSR